MGGETAFADDEEHFILDVVRQGYATQLQAAHPSGYVRVLHGVEHVAELVFLLGSIGIGSGADVFVQCRLLARRSAELWAVGAYPCLLYTSNAADEL